MSSLPIEAEESARENGAAARAPVNIDALLAKIRERLRDQGDKAGDTPSPFQPVFADADAGARKAGDLRDSSDLAWLNQNYTFGRRPIGERLDSMLATQPRTWKSRLADKGKRILARFLDRLLGEYLESELHYNAHVVRVLNDTSKYIDYRDSAIFWELIKKIDVDTSKALDRIAQIQDDQNLALVAVERRVISHLDEALRGVNKPMGEVLAFKDQTQETLKTVDSVVRGLEGALARLASQKGQMSAESPNAPRGTDSENHIPDYSYLLLENRFRGSEEMIKDRLSIYPPIFAGVEKPVLELGPGRGELQTLFREFTGQGRSGIPSYGIDIDEAMVQASREKGLDVRLEDGLAHLRSLPDQSLGGVIAVQVVEHLTRQQLHELFLLCAAKVVKGGAIIFETINPRSLLALSSNYFRDPTHVWPLHPDTLSYGMNLAGLQIEEVRLLSPVPQEAQLRPLAVEEYMTPRWSHMIELFNDNIKKLNDLLYGYQDYCVVARTNG